MSVNDVMAALCDELAEGDVAEPLGESFTLALLWLDQCRISGETLPGFLLALIAGAGAAAVGVAAWRPSGPWVTRLAWRERRSRPSGRLRRW